MLVELKVSHFAIIEQLHLQFKSGLNILSGETGAGKSVLLKSLSLLMGGKSSSDIIRAGSSTAVIEGSFDLSQRPDIQTVLQDMGIPVDENILIVRRVLSEDKSKVYLNGSLSSLNNLKDIVAPLVEVAGASAPLIEMTGQHDNRHLMSKAYHLDLLDQYAGNWDKRLLYENLWSRKTEIKQEIETLEKEAQDKAQRLDFLIYQRDEIAKLNLVAGEEETLEIHAKKLKNISKIAQFVEGAESALDEDDDSATVRLVAVLKKGHELASVDPRLEEILAKLETAKDIIGDSLYDLRQYSGKIETDPGAIEDVESRLSQLRKLQKKYGTKVEDILSSLERFENEILTLQNSEVHIEKLQKELKTIENDLNSLAKQLHAKRVSGSGQLEVAVNAELLDLNMKGVTFHVDINKTELNSHGYSDVEFVSQASSQDIRRPLSKFASGGELSRILLSLKKVVGSSHQPRTYLFDEVDTGVSGETAEKVGKKLRSIARGQQVICVTHLPQVAACGDAHFFIHKSPQKGSVLMAVNELVAKDRVQEIARLISGEKISKTSLAHAEQLLAEAVVH